MFYNKDQKSTDKINIYKYKKSIDEVRQCENVKPPLKHIYNVPRIYFNKGHNFVS